MGFIDKLPLCAWLEEMRVPDYIINTIKSEEHFPDANVEEVIHAKWEINCDGYYPYCSHCKTEPKNGVMSKRCPECGARMDGGKVNANL